MVDSILVRDRLGARITRLVPGDTTFVDAYLSDEDGFGDINRVDLTIARGQPSAVSGGPANGATFRWKPNDQPQFHTTSSTDSWQLVLPLCWADTNRTAVDSRLVRFAVVVSPIARASSTGEWLVEISPNSADDLRSTGFDMAERLALIEQDPSGSFQPGPAGSTSRSLVVPASGEVHVSVISNAPWRLSGRARRFVGQSDGAEGFDILGADGRLRWASDTPAAAAGVLDSSMAVLVDSLPATTTETATHQPLRLMLDHPAGLSQQAYRGGLDLVVALVSGGSSTEVAIPLTATVQVGGLPADSVRAEITPTQVVAGTPGQSFTVYMQLFMSAGSTGINQVRVALPPGFGTPRVTLVRRVLTSLAFTDSSVAGTAIAQLATPITSSTYLELRIATDVASQASATGVDLGVVVDDSRTLEPGVPASPGDANILLSSDRLRVTIAPGPVADLHLAPLAVDLLEVESFRFTATPRDQFGNPTSSSITWSAEGGIGFVDATGLFTATTPGVGRVVARAGTVADTAEVEVAPVEVASDLHALELSVAGGTLLPGGVGLEALRLRVVNHSSGPDTLQHIVLSDAAVGPGDAVQLDASWSEIELWQVPSGSETGTLLSRARFAAGSLTWDSLAIALAAGDSVEVSVRGGASLTARDGDLLRVALGNAGALRFASGGSASADWPFVTSPPLIVDGMSRAQTAITTLSSGISVGAQRQPVASVLVPADGYAADTLLRVNLLQLGDASPATDLPRLELWADDGDGTFESGSDALLGTLLWTGDRWERTGLQRPVPPGGARLFVTADASETAVEGALLRLALPSAPDVALGMSSGNSGPVDGPLATSEPVVISVADRMTLAAVELTPAAVAPGQSDVPLLALDLHNTFADARALTSLRVQNSTQGTGTQSQRDGEFTGLALRDDANSNGLLDGVLVDTVLAKSTLSEGGALFDGFSRDIVAGETHRFFVVGGVSLTGATDGDRLAVRVASALDVGMVPSSTMAAGWPLQSSSPPVVDGLVAAQLDLPGARGVTLGPGDGPVEALTVIVPRNGYLDDELTGLRLENAGSASSADIAELRLWLDGGDAAFDAAAGDDRDLGPLTRIGSEWRSPILSEPLGAQGARLFVTTRVAATPSDSVTLQLRIPIDGISTSSSDDGPRDIPVENPEAILISTAPLLSSLDMPTAASTIGQNVPVRLRVRNVGAERIDAVVPVLAATDGSGMLTVIGPPVPANADLAPGAETTFVWTSRSDATGDVTFTGYAQGAGATSGLPRRSLFARSNRHQVFASAADLDMFSVQSMPFAVNRGQAGVVPLSLTFEHPGSTDASDIRVNSITLRLEDQSGAPVAPADLLARVAVVEGATTYLERTSLEPTGGAMLLDLARPIRVRPGDPVTVAFQFDIASVTSVTDFRVMIPDSAGFAATDATSGAPVVVRLSGASYPIRSGLARVLSGARELRASASPVTERVVRGQPSVRLGVVRLQNAADPASGTDLRVGALRFDLADSLGATRRDAHLALARIAARSPFGLHAERVVTALDSTGLVLVLTNVLTVPAGASLDLELLADMRPGAPVGSYASVIRDSTWIDTRDASSGDPIPVSLASTPLTFGALLVESPAETLLASGVPSFPVSASIGRPGLSALTLTLTHPGTAGMSRIRVDSLDLELLDVSRTLLAPGLWFDRVTLLRRGEPIATQFALPSTPVHLTLAPTDVLLSPGETETLTVVVDIDAVAPASSIELLLRDSGWHATEANSGAWLPVAASPGEVMPFSSGVLRLDAPARRLAVGFESAMPAVLPPGGGQTPVATLRFENSAAVGSGPIDLAGLRLRAEREGGGALAIGEVAERLLAHVGGQLWASSGMLSVDSVTATLVAGSALSVASATSDVVELRLVPRAAASGLRFRLGLDRDDVGVIQPSSSLLAIAVEAAAGGSFPFWTPYAAVAEASLQASYANFPNPFAAGREPTRFAFVLERPSRVSLRILTSRGDLVRTLLTDAPLATGLQQSSQWDGRNGEGRLVMNGVYVAELVVEAAGAPRERLLRRVAVLR